MSRLGGRGMGREGTKKEKKWGAVEAGKQRVKGCLAAAMVRFA